MAFGLNRFSEDLDFTSKKNSNPGGEVRKAAEKLGLFGVEAEVRKGRGEKSSFRLLLEGPLFDGKEISKGSIRIDVSERNDAFGSKTALINQSYSEIPPFLAKVMPEDEILAEKARALVERSKARDLFDAWFLLKKGVAFEKTRVEKKMNFVGKKFSKKGLIEGIEKAGSDWERDLKPLIPLLPSFEQVKRETLAEVEKI
jgi:predicted nucleotidyltransferase component of viral defense system